MPENSAAGVELEDFRASSAPPQRNGVRSLPFGNNFANAPLPPEIPQIGAVPFHPQPAESVQKLIRSPGPRLKQGEVRESHRPARVVYRIVSSISFQLTMLFLSLIDLYFVTAPIMDLSRRAAACGRAQLLARKGASGRIQRPPELVPIPECCLDAAWMLREVSGKFAKNSGKIPVKFRQNLAKI